VSIRTRNASSGRSTLRVELGGHAIAGTIMRLASRGKKKKAARSAGFQICCSPTSQSAGRAACKGSGLENPRYSRLGSLRYFGSLRRVVSFLRHRLSAEEPPTVVLENYAVLPTKTHHFTCVLARIRARRIGQVIIAVRVKILPIFGKALTEKIYWLSSKQW